SPSWTGIPRSRPPIVMCRAAGRNSAVADGRLRAAILGCGRIAGAFAEPGGRPTTHAQALTGPAAQAFRLVAASDFDAGRAKAFAARWSVESTCTPEDLSEAGLDLVVVATPDATHARCLTSLVKGGRPPRLIVMEK